MDQTSQFEIKNDDQKFTYLGVGHAIDPKNPQFETIKKNWSEFIKATDQKPKVLIVEHWPTGHFLENENKAIKNEGEVGFVTSLAFRAGIGITCPEPERSLEFDFLAKSFPKEEVVYYYFARTIGQWHRLTEKPELKKYVFPYLERDKKISGWDNNLFTFEHLFDLHKRLSDKNFEETDGDFFKKVTNPTLDLSSINKIAKSLHGYRNKTIVDNIMRYWNSGNNIFMIYGNGHIEAHRQELEKRI